MSTPHRKPWAIPCPWTLPSNRFPYLVLVLAGSAVAFIVGHWPALVNPYVINDDVRQQIYWMQGWTDKELFLDDLLSRYARSYVPWGVQAIYYCASSLVNPVQFTKIVAGALFVITAGFLYGFGLSFGDGRTAALIVCVSLFFTSTMGKISGGIPQSFAFPLLAAWLFFFQRRSMVASSVVILFQSLLNPYIFLLCFTTHWIYCLRRHGWKIIKSVVAVAAFPGRDVPRLLLIHVPLVLGVLFVVLYVVTKPDEFGRIVTWADMAGKLEYYARGRYPILPRPPLLHEILRPWTAFFPFQELGAIAGWASAAAAWGGFLAALWRVHKKSGLRSLKMESVRLAGFGVFGYLLSASLLLYGVSSVLLMRLFLPERYVEFSFQIFYCVLVGAVLCVLIHALEGRRKRFPLVLFLFMVLAGLRTYHTGIYDYSGSAPLCRFLQGTPKNTFVAGHPQLMDNVVTFAARKAFLTYELSHTWYTGYWHIIRKRTFDFFEAYYSSDPQVIREFCSRNRIDYLVVRDEDFGPESPGEGRVYFAPFDDTIDELKRSTRDHAILNAALFPPAFQDGGIRAIWMKDGEADGSAP